MNKHDSDSEDAQSFHSFHNEEDTGTEANITSPPPIKSTTTAPSVPTSNTEAGDIAEPPDPEPSQPSTKPARFPPEEESALLSESNSQKATANTLFGKGSYQNAIQTYDRALASCPSYLDYELAVLRSNIAACHLKLSEWKEAIASADKGLECLERLEPLPTVRKERREGGGATGGAGDAEAEGDGQVQEVDEEQEAQLEALQQSGQTLLSVRKLQSKLLTRRAKARTESGGWSALQGAQDDYAVLLHPSMAGFMTNSDRSAAARAAAVLKPKLDAARDGEMAEMMGKLKGLGNSILKPFGLSTENFQFVKDEKSGGYSMNFNQGGEGR
ncbi:hypothetical protein K431DRAFT_289478 [Polychaeton citri CBS 116435]|uniref:Tetratricopeptide repeat protein 1 n=1 Tax=Polychaeton citri CBS 116435 TaxID=1314669 RepID=A0A9P4PYU8_9PEZI|nr:hypothetical protein K431DRAFT_289478 [Polychaeton citri CBS 116435]